MPDGLINGLYIIPILAVLILIHEFGHFFAARAVGAKVEEFGIGIPPRITGWTANGVLWSLNWIPFGGFVRVLGEDGKSMDPQSMNAKSPAQRAFFLAAGSAMNVFLAVVLTILIVAVQGVPRIDDNVYIAAVAPGSPAAAAGWEAGDRIVEIAGAPVSGATDVGRQARDFAGRPLSVVVERDGQRLETTVTPRANPPAGEGPTGVEIQAGEVIATVAVAAVEPGSPAAAAGLLPGDAIVEIGGKPAAGRLPFVTELADAAGGSVPIVIERDGNRIESRLAVPALPEGSDPLTAIGLTAELVPQFERVSPIQAIPVGIARTWEQTRQMLLGLRDLVTGRASLSQIAGPIGMGQITSEVVERSAAPLWTTLAQLSVLLSLNLAILNLLPLPALDGGRLLFVLIEVLRGGKRIPPEREGVVHLAGMIILVGLMFVVAFLDIGRLVGGGSLLP